MVLLHHHKRFGKAETVRIHRYHRCHLDCHQFDTDWDCHKTVNVIPSAWWDEGVTLSVLKSPTQEITKTSYKLTVEDVGPIYHVSGYTGGMHCCEVHLFLSKKLHELVSNLEFLETNVINYTNGLLSFDLQFQH